MERKHGFAITSLGVMLAVLVLNWDSTAGHAAPDFILTQAYGGTVDLSAYRARSVLLVFWTTSCGICRRELPLLDQLRTDFSARGVEVLAVNIGDLDGAREFMASERLRLTNLIDTDGATAERYKVQGVPKLVLIGPDGKIRRSAAGWQSERTLRQWLESAGSV